MAQKEITTVIIILRIFIFATSLFLSGTGYAHECIYEEYAGKAKTIIPLTTNLARLKTLIMPMDLENPKFDAQKRIKHGDYRLLSIANKGEEFPINEKYEPIDQKTICFLGSRLIEGVGGDWIESEEWIELSGKVYEYAKIYNGVIIGNFKEGKIPVESESKGQTP